MKAADNSHVRQRVKNAVDRCPRDSRDTVLHHLQDLIRCGVIVSLEDCLEDGTTLDREGHALAAAQQLQLPQSLGDLTGLRAHNAWQFILFGNLCQSPIRKERS
jgi:hypothetical protein